jgi:hypothetical protein
MTTLHDVLQDKKTTAPFDDTTRTAFLAQAMKTEVSVEELLRWACAHTARIQTQFQDQDKHWTVEDVLDLLALAIVKLQQGHPATDPEALRTSPITRGLVGRTDHFRRLLASA